jgi:PAS domain S-box-containing protein
MMLNSMVEEKAEVSAQFFAHLLQNMSSGMIVIDQDGLVTSANQMAASLLGMDIDSMVGMPYQTFWPENLLPLSLPIETEIYRETLLRHSNGRSVPVALTITPIASKNKGHKLISITDLGAVERFNDSLTHTQRLAGMGTLTASIAHELNNPISIITSACANLQFDIDDNALSLERLQHYVEMVEQSAWRCVRIVEVLRNYSMDGALQVAVTNWNKIVEDALTLVKQQFEGQFKVNIKTDLAVDLKTVVCDHNRMTQVLINLLTNARDAMKPFGGTIYVKTWMIPSGSMLPGSNLEAYHGELATSDYYAVSVSDSGTGIEPEMIGKIFEPFFTTKSNGSGTGLGLFISKRIVEQHNGRLWVENNPDGGATFVVLLPRRVQ